MPAKPQWLLHLDDIVGQLQPLSASVVDRAVIERIFGVRRRQAIQLLHRFGGYQSAQSFLVDRLQLIGKLEAMGAGDECAGENHRRKRLDECLEKGRHHGMAAAVRIPISADTLTRKVSELPEGIRLQRGRLEVDFSGVEELLVKLFELAQAAANDYEGFCRCAAE